MTVQMIPVVSSNISSVGYDQMKGTLHVLFKNGGLYVYAGVPHGTFDALLAAESVGSFLNKNIKKQFACVPLTAVQDDPETVDIPVEGILGMVISEGAPPHWLCMHEQAQEEYIQKGRDFIARFIKVEIEAKKQRDKMETTASKRESSS